MVADLLVELHEALGDARCLEAVLRKIALELGRIRKRTRRKKKPTDAQALEPKRVNTLY